MCIITKTPQITHIYYHKMEAKNASNECTLQRIIITNYKY